MSLEYKKSLIKAYGEGDTKLIKMLLEDGDYLPLFTAIEYGRLDIVNISLIIV